MAYTFDFIEARDPSNTAAFASNASITIYAPGDATKTPLAITDTTGSPLPNPITVNQFGYGPAFMHATLDRVAWAGAGFSNFFTAYEGIKDEAVAARQAAEAVQSQAAAGNFKGSKGDKGDKGDKGLDGSNVLPTDDAIEQAIKTAGTKTATALSATYAQQWKANTAYAAGQPVVNPSGDVVTAKAAFTTGATYDATKWNASTTTVAKVKDIQGGAFPAVLRAPVLTVEKSWPNRDADYRILWTENAGQTLYAIGYDMGVRKSTDGGATWTFKGYQGFGIADTGAFLKLASGTLLMMRPGTPAAIQRSTDDGATWTAPFNTATTPASRTSTYAMGVQSWAQDPVSGAVYYGEYDIANDKTTLLVYRSTDDGATWPVFYTFPGYASTDPNKVRHVHSIDYDTVMGRMIFMIGDSDPAAGMYRVTADGTSVEPLLLNRDVPGIPDAARAIGIIPFADYLCWTGDSSGNPYLMRMARTEIGKANPIVERVYRLNSTGWFTIKASDDGSRWIFSASPENTSIRIDRAAHLYSVEDQGKTVYEIGALAIPSTAGGIPAIAPVGQSRIHGDMMFLQAHSAGRNAVWKVQLAKGTTPLPWPMDSPTAYLPTTVNSGAVDLAASPNNTQVFAHTKAPYFAKKLHIFEMGCIGQSGDVSMVRVRAKKKSDGTVLFSSAVASERAQRRAEAGGPIISIDMTAADDIEFEIYLSAVGAARCTATVTYGFGR
ncbi:WD40/YVTN/BNR-like repeat-containing protein [Pseudarthrobacter sp. alpha12b]